MSAASSGGCGCGGGCANDDAPDAGCGCGGTCGGGGAASSGCGGGRTRSTWSSPVQAPAGMGYLLLNGMLKPGWEDDGPSQVPAGLGYLLRNDGLNRDWIDDRAEHPMAAMSHLLTDQAERQLTRVHSGDERETDRSRAMMDGAGEAPARWAEWYAESVKCGCDELMFTIATLFEAASATCSTCSGLAHFEISGRTGVWTSSTSRVCRCYVSAGCVGKESGFSPCPPKVVYDNDPVGFACSLNPLDLQYAHSSCVENKSPNPVTVVSCHSGAGVTNVYALATGSTCNRPMRDDDFFMVAGKWYKTGWKATIETDGTVVGADCEVSEPCVPCGY